jgi:hypothetical protein
MSRRLAALKPQLNRIRAWAHEGSTDAWIAHQLETTAEAVRAFRQEHGIERGGPAPLAPITPDSVVEAMLAEEAAALEAGPEPSEPDRETEAEAESAAAQTPRRRTRRRVTEEVAEGPETAQVPEAAPAEAEAADEDVADEAAAEAPARSNRRRGARGGSSRSSQPSEPPAPAEPDADEPRVEAESGDAPLDEEPGRSARKRGRRRGRGRGPRGLEARLLTGSVLLLDPAVAGDATFQEHWADAGPLRVEVSTDAIVLRRIAVDAEPERSDRPRADRTEP